MILMEEHDHKRCALHISKKISKPLIKSLGIKQSCKSSYTIFEGLSNERCGERVKAKNCSMKIVNKRGEVNFNQWMKMVRGHNGLS